MFDFDMPPLDWRICYIPKPKKPGEFRKLTIPNDALKAIQRQILKYLYTVKQLRPTVFAHGFVPFRNTSTGVVKHDKHADAILCMDVDGFFDHFPVNVVLERLKESGIGEVLAEKIIKACSYNNTIPQGGPCSPYLTNIGMFEMDCMLAAFAKQRGFIYTRYADDIQMSIRYATREAAEKHKNSSYKNIFIGVNALLKEKLGIHLKRTKSHVMRLNGRTRRELLGITIRDDGKGYNAPMKTRSNIRAAVYNLAKKVNKQNKRLQPEDYQEWAKIVGYVRYFDNIRSYGEAEAATADPRIQEHLWNYLEEIFKADKIRRTNGKHGTEHRQQHTFSGSACHRRSRRSVFMAAARRSMHTAAIRDGGADESGGVSQVLRTQAGEPGQEQPVRNT